MSRELSVSSVFKGIFDPSIFLEEETTCFRITLCSPGCLFNGHVQWLKREFEKWKNEMLNVSGVVSIDHIHVDKGVYQEDGSVNKPGQINISVVVSGGFDLDPSKLVDGKVLGKTVAFVRKTLYETVMEKHKPAFDFEHPRFPMNHVSEYHFHLHARHANADTISKLNPSPLVSMLRTLNAHIASVTIFGHRLNVYVNWIKDFSDEDRHVVEGVLLAYLESSGYLSSSRIMLCE